MSLSWRDRTAVFLGADAVHLAHYGAGFGSRPSQQHSEPFEANGRAQNVVEALRSALGAFAALKAPLGDADIVVSNHYVRFALVPDAGKLRNHAERLVAARHTLQSVYGDAAARWRVVLDGASRKGAAVAAGIDTELVDGIVATLTAARLQARTVRPLFAAALNASRRSLGSGPAWFGVAEPGRLALAYVDKGAVQSLRSHRLRAVLSAELPVLLEQNRLTGSANGSPAAEGGRVVLATSDATPVESSAPWAIESVPLDLAGRAW